MNTTSATKINSDMSGNQHNNPAVTELNNDQANVHDHDNRKETLPQSEREVERPGEGNPQIGERPANDPTKIDPTKQDERDNDPTRIKPGIHEPAKTDPTRIDPTRITEPPVAPK